MGNTRRDKVREHRVTQFADYQQYAIQSALLWLNARSASSHGHGEVNQIVRVSIACQQPQAAIERPRLPEIFGSTELSNDQLVSGSTFDHLLPD